MALTKSGNHTIKVDINTTPVQVEEFLQKLGSGDHLRGTPLPHGGSVLLYALGNELVEKPSSTDARMEHMAAARMAISVVFDPFQQFEEFPGVAEALDNIRTVMYRTSDPALVRDLRSPVTVVAGVQKVLYQKNPSCEEGADAGTLAFDQQPTSLAPALHALNARTERPTPQQKQVFENLLGILLSSSKKPGS